MVKFGIDRVGEYRHLLEGRVALITAPSGRTADNRSSIDRLKKVCDLRLLLAPEHGVRGDKGAGELFEDCTTNKMYITGGIGSTSNGEAFTIPYDLPNKGAYTETCASIGMMFFANRMFRIDPAQPAFGFIVPITTRSNLACTIAPAHIGQGSTVT